MSRPVGALPAMAMGLDTRALARRIRELQRPDGRIMWIEAGLFDPWNHVESVLGLCAVGDMDAAAKGMDALVDLQDDDGGWTGDMGCAAPMDATGDKIVVDAPPTLRDTNFTAYVAMGAWRVARQARTPGVAQRYADMVARALEWVIARQRDDGAILWRDPDPGELWGRVGALHAGSASIYRSLDIGGRLLGALDRPADHVAHARTRLGVALRRPTTRWLDKSEFAMDWYYPVISGALSRTAGRARLAARWRAFVHPRFGCRCVENEPWATAAETSELAIAAACAGAPRLGRRLMERVSACAAPAGDLWMGHQFVQNRAWPLERPSWTAGAALLALDVLRGYGPSAEMFLSTSPEIGAHSLKPAANAAPIPARAAPTNAPPDDRQGVQSSPVATAD